MSSIKAKQNLKMLYFWYFCSRPTTAQSNYTEMSHMSQQHMLSASLNAQYAVRSSKILYHSRYHIIKLIEFESLTYTYAIYVNVYSIYNYIAHRSISCIVLHLLCQYGGYGSLGYVGGPAMGPLGGQLASMHTYHASPRPQLPLQLSHISDVVRLQPPLPWYMNI